MNVPIEQKEKLKREIKIKKETDKVEFEFALIKSSILMFCDGNCKIYPCTHSFWNINTKY